MRRRQALDLALATLFLLLLALLVAQLREADRRFEGRARVVDGDTILLAGERLRLAGIDAPERDQFCGAPPGWACGAAARARLALLIGEGSVSCRATERDRYRRWLAECQAGSRPINAAMVEVGLAIASGDYEREERRARAAGKGIWSGPFERPGAWRARHGENPSEPHMGSWIDALLRAVKTVLRLGG